MTPQEEINRLRRQLDGVAKARLTAQRELSRILDALRTFTDRSLMASGGHPCVHPDDFWALKAEFDAVTGE